MDQTRSVGCVGINFFANTHFYALLLIGAALAMLVAIREVTAAILGAIESTFG